MKRLYTRWQQLSESERIEILHKVFRSLPPNALKSVARKELDVWDSQAVGKIIEYCIAEEIKIWDKVEHIARCPPA